jgi:hypothetical protein
MRPRRSMMMNDRYQDARETLAKATVSLVFPDGSEMAGVLTSVDSHGVTLQVYHPFEVFVKIKA